MMAAAEISGALLRAHPLPRPGNDGGGLLARGTAPIDACLWGLFLHAETGRRLRRPAPDRSAIAPASLARRYRLLMEAMR